jgi:excinuclease ABC subunit C
MDPALRQKLDHLPAEPGCYLMKDRRGEVVTGRRGLRAASHA